MSNTTTATAHQFSQFYLSLSIKKDKKVGLEIINKLSEFISDSGYELIWDSEEVIMIEMFDDKNEAEAYFEEYLLPEMEKLGL